MATLGSALLGFRPDLERRWWHRLFKVLFALLMAASLALGVWLTTEYRPDATFENSVILSDLNQFTRTSKGQDEIIKSFINSAGDLGLLNHTTKRIDWLSSYTLGKGRCSSEVFMYLDKNGERLKRQRVDYGTELIPIPLTPGLATEDMSNCWLGSTLHVQSGDQIVKYELKASSVRLAQITFFGKWLVSIAVIWLVLGNVYYRGLIYVILGKRKKAEETAAV
jgi:hypothetical protein